MDLLTYLQLCDPQNLVHLSGDTYCTREHDSLKISNGKWHWFSRHIGGRSALDYAHGEGSGHAHLPCCRPGKHRDRSPAVWHSRHPQGYSGNHILYDHEYSPELMKLHIIGGGGCLIRNFAEVDSSRVKILSDICATAKGYEYMAEMVLRKRDRA